jgi:hypothetical protein
MNSIKQARRLISHSHEVLSTYTRMNFCLGLLALEHLSLVLSPVAAVVARFAEIENITTSHNLSDFYETRKQ